MSGEEERISCDRRGDKDRIQGLIHERRKNVVTGAG
jgi:hypothetical protein